MPLTNFPGGASSFGMPLIPDTVGKVFYVCSLGGIAGVSAGGAHEGGQSPERPFATIANAISAARASKGDVIIVMPGHAETVSAAAGIALSKSGVAIIGLGLGSMRPTITFATSTAATITIAGSDVILKNFLFTNTIDELVTMLAITGANVTIDAVDVVEGASAQVRSFCTTTAAADDLKIKNCKHITLAAPGAAAAWIGLIGTDRAEITDNVFQVVQANSASSFVIQSLTTAPLNINILRNRIYQAGGTTIASAISLVAATTGRVDDNRIYSSANAIAGVNAIASCAAANNLVSNTVNTSGILDPVADT